MAKRLPGHTGALLAGHDGVDHQIAHVDDGGNLRVGGGVASGATDTGNPLKVGGVYRSTLPTYTDAQRTELQSDTKGSISVIVRRADNGTAQNMDATNADGIAANSGTAFAGTNAFTRLYNGASFDRERNNTDLTVLASAARTATLNSSDLVNYNGRGVHVVVDVTNAGTGSITITISGRDALGGLYYTLLTGAAVTTVSTNVYKIFPGATAAANAAANDILPRTWRVTVTHNNANSITYSVSASVIL